MTQNSLLLLTTSVAKSLELCSFKIQISNRFIRKFLIRILVLKANYFGTYKESVEVRL